MYNILFLTLFTYIYFNVLFVLLYRITITHSAADLFVGMALDKTNTNPGSTFGYLQQ